MIEGEVEDLAGEVCAGFQVELVEAEIGGGAFGGDRAAFHHGNDQEGVVVFPEIEDAREVVDAGHDGDDARGDLGLGGEVNEGEGAVGGFVEAVAADNAGGGAGEFVGGIVGFEDREGEGFAFVVVGLGLDPGAGDVGRGGLVGGGGFGGLLLREVFGCAFEPGNGFAVDDHHCTFAGDVDAREAAGLGDGGGGEEGAVFGADEEIVELAGLDEEMEIVAVGLECESRPGCLCRVRT